MSEKWGSLHQDNLNRTGRTGLHWRKAWIWPMETETLILEQLEDVPRPVVHVCSGSKTMGDLTIDLHHPRADVHADARQLPLEDESAGCVLMDPPWTIKDLRERHAFIREAGRILQVGGIFLLYGPWMPSPTWARLDRAWIRDQTSFRLPGSAITFTRWKKVHSRRTKHEEALARGKTPDEKNRKLTEVLSDA